MSTVSQQKMAEIRQQILAFRDGRKQRVPDELVDIDFKVLQTAVNNLELPVEVKVKEDYSRRDVDAKLDYNKLTDTSRKIITEALIYSEEVETFIRVKAANIDSTFPNRLKQFFKGVYADFHCNGLRGDDLFDALVLTLEQQISRIKFRKAVYAILAHLFEKCDVFEK